MDDIAVGWTGTLHEGSSTMREPPDYDAIEREQWRTNFKEVSERLRTGDLYLTNRINTFVWRFGFAAAAVKEKIRRDRMFAAWFTKEPRRQGFHEQVAADWLRKCPEVQGFRVLPKSGTEALYVTSDGYIRAGQKSGKSLDFSWRVGTTQFYASHKYTKEGGGNQDSQFMEMLTLLEHFQRGTENASTVLVVIVDGSYYTQSKMDTLRQRVRDRPPRSYAVPIQDVPMLFNGA